MLKCSLFYEKVFFENIILCVLGIWKWVKKPCGHIWMGQRQATDLKWLHMPWVFWLHSAGNRPLKGFNQGNDIMWTLNMNSKRQNYKVKRTKCWRTSLKLRDRAKKKKKKGFASTFKGFCSVDEVYRQMRDYKIVAMIWSGINIQNMRIFLKST